MASHSINNSGPEPTAYDRMRHEKMHLRNISGATKFFVSGSAPSRWCDCGCDKLKVWCPNRASNK
jgi:hypothetical protein